MLLETVRSTIKPIDQPLELALQRDTEIETKIASPFSLKTPWVKSLLALISFRIENKEGVTVY